MDSSLMNDLTCRNVKLYNENKLLKKQVKKMEELMLEALEKYNSSVNKYCKLVDKFSELSDKYLALHRGNDERIN